MMTEQAAMSSPIPSEIIAKTVPAFRVEKEPTMVARPSPKRPPKIGSTGSGIGSSFASTMFIRCMQKKPPTPM